MARRGGFSLGGNLAASCGVLHLTTIELQYQDNHPSENTKLYLVNNTPTCAIEEVKNPSGVRQLEPRLRPRLQREFSHRVRMPVFASPHLGAADRSLLRVDLLIND